MQAAIIRTNGVKVSVGKVEVYRLQTAGAVSFAAINTDPVRAAELTIDCSGSTNMRSDRGQLGATCKLQPDRSVRAAADAARPIEWLFSLPFCPPSDLPPSYPPAFLPCTPLTPPTLPSRPPTFLFSHPTVPSRLSSICFRCASFSF